MTLPEALAVMLTINGYGYPTKPQRELIEQAQKVIAATIRNIEIKKLSGML